MVSTTNMKEATPPKHLILVKEDKEDNNHYHGYLNDSSFFMNLLCPFLCQIILDPLEWCNSVMGWPTLKSTLGGYQVT